MAHQEPLARRVELHGLDRAAGLVQNLLRRHPVGRLGAYHRVQVAAQGVQ